MSITACGRHNHGVEGTLGRLCAVGAMMCSAEVFDRVYSEDGARSRAFFDVWAQPARMVAALATLQTIDDEDIVDRARVTGEAFMKGWPARREVRALSRGARQGSDIASSSGANLFRVKSRWKMMEGARKGSSPSLWWDPVPPTQDLDPGRRRQHERRQAAPPADRRPGGGGLLRGRARRRCSEDAHRNSALLFEFGRTLAKSALRREPS